MGTPGTPMATGARPVRLTYAARPRNTARRVRQIGVLATLAVVAVQAARHGPAACRWGRLLYWQHRSMTYVPPPGQVIYARPDDPPPRIVTRNGIAFSEFVGGSS